MQVTVSGSGTANAGSAPQRRSERRSRSHQACLTGSVGAWNVCLPFLSSSKHSSNRRSTSNSSFNSVSGNCTAGHQPYTRAVTPPTIGVKRKGSPYSITERRVPELIPVLGSQPAGDVSHKPGGRLPLLSARPAVTRATLKRAATNFAAWCTEARWV